MDNNIYVVFYKDNYKWWSRLIKWFTKGKYSHCEFYIDGCLTGISNDQRVRKLKQPLNCDKWDIYKLKVDIRHAINGFYESTKGCKYDWQGVLWSCIFNRKKHDYEKYTCSEWVLNVVDNATHIMPLKNYIMYSPYEVYQILKNKNLI